MEFNRSGNGRSDKSGRSSNRSSGSDDRPKRSYSTAGKSSPSSSQGSPRPDKKFSRERPGEKKSFSPSAGKAYSEGRGGDIKSSENSGRRSFSAGKKPYTGRPDNTFNNQRTEGTDGPLRKREPFGAKKSFSASSKPYSGRAADAGSERPSKRGFSDRPASDRSSRGSDNTGYKPRKSQGASFGNNDKPGNKKFGERSSTPLGFKKPFREKPANGRTRDDQGSSYENKTYADAPVRTLRGRKKGTESKESELVRLNRYISNAGICSRRKADELIQAGVVSVNGVVVSELGHKVNPQKDEIKYNGETLRREKMVYVLLNKPKDYITTTEDPQERRTVMHLVEKASKERIYPIGRLDRNTTGLLLMTNDGDLADKLSHPRNNIVKLYQVELSKSLTQGDLNKIAFGLELEDGFIKPDSVSYVAGGSKREIGIQVHSGKNRIVRRIFEHLGYEVVKLDRSVYANLTKKDLPRGRWRYLEENEVIQLKHLI